MTSNPDTFPAVRAPLPEDARGERQSGAQNLAGVPASQRGAGHLLLQSFYQKTEQIRQEMNSSRELLCSPLVPSPFSPCVGVPPRSHPGMRWDPGAEGHLVAAFPAPGEQPGLGRASR